LTHLTDINGFGPTIAAMFEGDRGAWCAAFDTGAAAAVNTVA